MSSTDKPVSSGTADPPITPAVDRHRRAEIMAEAHRTVESWPAWKRDSLRDQARRIGQVRQGATNDAQ
jgi:hypothetical protein